MNIPLLAMCAFNFLSSALRAQQQPEFPHKTMVQTYQADMVIPEMSSQQVDLVIRMRTGWHLQ